MSLKNMYKNHKTYNLNHKNRCLIFFLCQSQASLITTSISSFLIWNKKKSCIFLSQFHILYFHNSFVLFLFNHLLSFS